MAGLNAKKAPGGGGNDNRVKQEPIEPGTYPARVAQILDLGLQPQRPYQGEEKPPANEIMITYELVDEFMLDENGEPDEDKPRWISETIPLRNIKADLAKSTKRYKALDPDNAFDGDFSMLAGAPCNVTVVNNAKGDKVYTNITNVSTMRARDAAKLEDLKNEPKVFSLEEPDMTVFGSLPEWLQDKMKGNLEFKGSALEKALEAPEKPAKAKPEKPKAKPKAKAEEAQDEAEDEPEPEEYFDGDEEEDEDGGKW